MTERMSEFAHRPRPLHVALAAVAVAALLIALVASGSPEPTAAEKSGGAKGDDPAVVGKVTAVGGTAEISVDSQGKKPRSLEQGDKLYLGDVVDPDPGVTATLVVKDPGREANGKDIVEIDPGADEEHSVVLERIDQKRTQVTISDLILD